MTLDAPLPIFVYGTLRPGRRNWPIVERLVEHHRPARLSGHRLYLLDYPAVVSVGEGTQEPAGPSVLGDVLWLDASHYAESLAQLDRFEDHRPDDPAGSLYVRARRPVRLTTSTSPVAIVAAPVVDAWVFVAGPSHEARLTAADELTSGEYLDD